MNANIIEGKLYIEVSYYKGYGKTSYYPVSPDAKFLIKLFEKKVFCSRHIREMMRHGWTVVIIQEAIEDFSKDDVKPIE